jgi:hypothetical protein
MDKRIDTLVKKGVGGQPHASSRPPLEPVVSRHMAIEGQKRKLEDCRKEQLSLQQDALITGIKHPNKSRLHGESMKLMRAIQKNADKCHRILIALRLLRKTSDPGLDLRLPDGDRGDRTTSTGNQAQQEPLAPNGK